MSPSRRDSAALDQARESERPDYRVGALAKGLRVLSVFDEQRPTRTVSELAEVTAIPMPTVYRIVMTLVGEGYLDQLPTGEYRPSVRSLTLGSSALRSLDLVGVATPELQRLSVDTGETANLAVLDRDHILYLVRLRNADLVTANIQVGSRLPAASTSIGKLLLAHAADDDLDRLISPAIFDAAAGPNAIRSAASLRRELTVVRDQRWALQDEELAYGLRSVAAPIKNAEGQVIAGINLAVQAREWSVQRLMGELLPPLQATSDKITMLLGGHVDVG